MLQTDRVVFGHGVRHPLLNSCKKYAVYSTAIDKSMRQPKPPLWSPQYRYFCRAVLLQWNVLNHSSLNTGSFM
ncbi:hypothetical protein WJX77_004742 [Trebouxia sp. C0004]